MQNCYQPEIECMSREEMKALQSERLAGQVRHVWENVSHYKNKMTEAKLTPDDIKTVDDLYKLPFTAKDDFRKTYPYGMLAVPLKDAVRIHTTTGTTGKRVIAYYTKEDIDIWEDCCARAIVAAGGTNEDVVQVAYGYGLFTGGMGMNGGSQKLGCLTLPISSGFTDRQLEFMCDLEATILCCTPSYAEYIAESAEESGMINKIKLKTGIFGAEAWSNEMRTRLEKKLGIKAYNIYGTAEVIGPGVSFECTEQNEMHINEDHFIAEVIDPETCEVLPYGSKGEIVFTCISKRALPTMRFRTRDISVLNRDDCPCGRTLIKMSRLMGRSDDMLIIRGVNVFPSQIETVLIKYGLSANYQLVVDRVNHADTLEVHVELTPEMFSDTVRGIENREKELSEKIKNVLGVSAKIKLVAPKSITRSEGKAVRVVDNRKM